MKPAGKIARRVPFAPEFIALAVYSLIPFAILVGYFLQLPDAMAAGMSPLESSSVFLTRLSLSLSPVTLPLFGGLMICMYLFGVCAPMAITTTHGKAQARNAFESVASLLLDAVLSIIAWWRGLDTGWKLPAEILATNPLRPSVQRGLPSHLSTGWSPGINPQVVYD